MQEREPAVAGSFYEGTADRLRLQVARCFDANPPSAVKEQLLGLVVPHAGLMFSGHVAAAAYEKADLPDHLILLGPNHTGLGDRAAINTRGGWRTPLGICRIDEPLADELKAASPLLTEDSVAHIREHSLEVQLPFLQTTAGNATFVPICLATYRYELCAEIGEAIARVVRVRIEQGERVAILASSDLNHYENQEITLRKDQLAIDEILRLDARNLWDVVRENEISMCGIIPVTTMLVALRSLGATKARLLKHATSGEINHDYKAVVGYASILIR